MVKSYRTAEGYAVPLADGADIEYYYYVKDHLGTIRVVLNSQGAVENAADYYPYGKKMPGRNYFSSSYEGYRYQFTGHEQDGETGYQYHGARYYNEELGKYMSVDPLAVKFPSISTYNYVAGNPIILIDPDGRRFIDFDNDGNYIGISKDNWWHNLWNGSKGRVLNEDGSVNQKFKFADPKHDVEDIKAGKIKSIEFVKESDVIDMILSSGGFDPNNKTKNTDLGDRYDYIKEEGKGGGNMDFSYTQMKKVYPEISSDPLDPSLPPTSMLFLINGVAHNHMNFGNFLFGASGEAMGFYLIELSLGAHYNSVRNSGQNGYTPQLDSSDDQLSIKEGFKYAKKKHLEKIEIYIGNPEHQ